MISERPGRRGDELLHRARSHSRATGDEVSMTAMIIMTRR